MLEALEEAGVTATFFVLAERVEQHPELLERIVLPDMTCRSRIRAPAASVYTA